MARQGTRVQPYHRLNKDQVERIHRASMEILSGTGIQCFNATAAGIFGGAGAEVTEVKGEKETHWILKIPEKVILDAVDSAPNAVTLGARNPENALVLDGRQPVTYFASGSETNNWLEMDIETFASTKDPSREARLPVFRTERGTVEKLATAARLCEKLDSWDGFLRPVNIQDGGINDDNKDANKFFASLNNTSKHVMAGLTSLDRLDDVMTMAEIIAGGKDELLKNPVVSFITSIIKSPLQLVDDTTDKTIEIAKRGMPVVISSAPQGGSTAPVIEGGIVAQINAELLVGIALTQLVNKGAPVLYGSVPGRASMEDLSDSYGVPEFSLYNIDCVQMAAYYGIPCYSSGGVSDGKTPGIQASVERLFSQLMVALSGPQYIHYAFGLLEKTNTFCPVQAVLDDAHVAMIKRLVREPEMGENAFPEVLEQIRRVMDSSHKLFTRFARTAMRSGSLAPAYPYESKGMTDDGLLLAQEKMDRILAEPPNHISKESTDRIFEQVSGILPELRNG